jgi:hypothetical protein
VDHEAAASTASPSTRFLRLRRRPDGDPGRAPRLKAIRELRAAGFDSGLTPVLDCRTDPESVVVGDRAYAEDAEAVAACGTAFTRAAVAEGLIPVAKHFPGHGRTPLDSHVALPEVDAPAGELERTELVPFRQALAAGCPAVMVAHVRYPALDPEWPASLSAGVVAGLLRRGLDFGGLVLSDDLEMAAVRSGWGVGTGRAVHRAAILPLRRKPKRPGGRPLAASSEADTGRPRWRAGAAAAVVDGGPARLTSWLRRHRAVAEILARAAHRWVSGRLIATTSPALGGGMLRIGGVDPTRGESLEGRSPPAAPTIWWYDFLCGPTRDPRCNLASRRTFTHSELAPGGACGASWSPVWAWFHPWGSASTPSGTG